jgi:hypothetical protein
VKESQIRVHSPFEQIQVFCQFAETYKDDYLTDFLAPIRTWPLRKFFNEIKKRYCREVGEQILRPLYYWQDGVGGDCDDASIQYMSFFRAAGISPDKIIICEAREPENDYYSHIFIALARGYERIWLDNLPNSQFNRLDYPGELVRLSLMSDYL